MIDMAYGSVSVPAGDCVPEHARLRHEMRWPFGRIYEVLAPRHAAEREREYDRAARVAKERLADNQP